MPGLPVSVLDMVFVWEGRTAAEALTGCLADAAAVERLGYQRYWVVEHHNTDGTGSAAPAVLAGRIAAHTRTLRVGSGGVMLNNHSPLAVAEQFATLEAFFPGRVDLGVGRAAGTDAVTARLLRQGAEVAPADFADRVATVRALLHGGRGSVQVTPQIATAPPMFLLGSSVDSAELAGRLGLSFAFAHHLAPRSTAAALQRYRDSFVPARDLLRPYAIVSVTAIGSGTDDHADWLSTSMKRAFVDAQRGMPSRMRAPNASPCTDFSAAERHALAERLHGQIIGGPATIRDGLAELVAAGADEVMLITPVADPADRVASYEAVAAVAADLSGRWRVPLGS
jgi:luciferase family oxidoreductase group 1